MPVLSKLSLSTPAGFKQYDIVMDSNGVKHSVVYVNDDGTMAVKGQKSFQTKWRVQCADYALVIKPPALNWPPPDPAPSRPRARFGTARIGVDS